MTTLRIMLASMAELTDSSMTVPANTLYLVYALEGSVTVKFNESSYTLGSRQALLLPGKAHCQLCSDGCKLYQMLFELAEQPAPGDAVLLDARTLSLLADIMDEANPCLCFVDSERIYLLLHLIIEELVYPNRQSACAVQNLVAATIAKLHGNITYHNSANIISPIAIINAYLADAIDGVINLTVPAREANYSVRQLKRVYKQYKKRSICEYINHVRIDQGALMLTWSDRTITEVSRACGFANRQSFIRNFKKQMGVTPFAFRRCYRRSDIVRPRVYSDAAPR